MRIGRTSDCRFFINWCMFLGNAARAPKTAAAVTATAAGILLLAGALAPYVSPDMPDDWPLAALPAFLGDAFAHIQDSITITAIGSISDDANTRVLDGPRATDIVDLRGQLFAFVVAGEEDGIQILNITTPGNIIAVANMTDDSNVVLDDPRDIELFIHGGMLYAAVAAYSDNGVQILDVTGHFAGSTPIVAVSNVTDTGSLELSGASAIDVFDYDGKRYAAVAAYSDSGVQILNLTEPTTRPIPTVDNLDADADTLLSQVNDIKVFELNNKPYAIATSYDSDAIQVLNLTDLDNIVAVNNIADTTDLLLGGPSSLDIVKHSNGLTYAVVTSDLEHGIQLFDLTSLPRIIPAGGISDADDNGSTTSQLRLPSSVKMFVFSDNTYAAVGTVSDGIQIVNITDPDNPVNAGSLASTISDPFDYIRDIDALPPGDRLVLTSYGDDKIRMVQLAGKAVDNGPPQIVILNQTVNGGDTVTLEPVGVVDPNGDPMTYRWGYDDVLMAERLGVIIDDHLSRSTTFVAPHVLHDTDIVFKFEAVDHHGGKFVVDDNGAFVLEPGARDDGYSFVRVWVTVRGTQPPIVDAGMNQTVHAGTLVTLSGSVNDPEGNDPVTHLWVAESNATLADPNALTTTFTAPIVAVETILQFILFGTDSLGAVASDSVYITVLANQPPQFDIGPNRVVDEGDQVTLTSGTVTDPENDTPFIYDWWIAVDSPADGPPITIQDETIPTITFTAPLVTVDTTYHVLLLVTDSRGAADSRVMTLTVRDVPSARPIVTVDGNQAVDEGDQVTLTGSATDPEGEAMTYDWTCQADSRPIINAGTTKSVTFTAPEVMFRDTAYTCTFTATDPHGSTGSAQLILLVRDVPPDGPVLKLIGDYTPTVTVGNAWTDPGASCVTLHDGNALRVSTSGSVDTGTVGSYDIKYSCSHNGIHTSQTRTVTVQQAADDQPPAISLVYIRTVVAAGVTDPDYSSDAICRDNEDGDISHTITTTVSFGSNDTATITYSCTDSANHTVEKTQKAKAPSANTPPEMDVIGGFMHLKVGDTFEDPGAVCHDAEDGTFDAVMISNTVDTTAAGTYAVVYQCTDSGGMHNNGGGARTVWVIEGDLPPVLTISDDSDIIIPVNGTWSVPSATCTDKEDGDLTDEIEVRHVHSVDVTKPGTYYITYYCVDSTNQHVQTSIKVIVEEGS